MHSPEIPTEQPHLGVQEHEQRQSSEIGQQSMVLVVIMMISSIQSRNDSAEVMLGTFAASSAVAKMISLDQDNPS